MTRGRSITFLSVCSGIEAASVAFAPLGWQAVGFAEIDKAASKLLAHRYGSNMPGEPLAQQGVPNFGDFTAIDLKRLGRVDVLCGGTPCQAFSVAGKRLSLADARGNLSLSFAVLAHELARSHGLQCALWENVPGVLSTSDNAFGCFLAALVGADDALHLPQGLGRWPDAGMAAGPWARAAWRVFDAQYFGLAQRRKRVFVVVGFAEGLDPAAILFERQGLPGDFAPGRDARQDTPGTLSACTQGGGGLGTDFECDGGLVSATLTAGMSASASRMPDEQGTLIVATLPIAFDCKASGQSGFGVGDLAATMRSMGHKDSHQNAGGHLAVAYDMRGRDGGAQFEGPHDTANMRAASGGSSRSYIAEAYGVRRLTPRECERLQGFPDDYTLISATTADGPRYKQLGNSWAVPVARWIGARINAQLRPMRVASDGDPSA